MVLFLQLERECEKILKQQCTVYHEGLQFSMERGAGNGKKKKKQIYESSSMHVSGRALLLTMEPHWQRLGGHHEGAIEGEDSQELQG